MNAPPMQHATTNRRGRNEVNESSTQQHLLALVSGEGELPMSNLVPWAIGFCAESPVSNVLLDTIL
jgi:hypothetical protein